MVSVADAWSIVSENLYQPSTQVVPVAAAINYVLAEKIYADRDLPAMNRVTMDGIAILFDTWNSGNRRFKIEATLAAGSPTIKLNDKQYCIEVMTGAGVPEGTDTVIPYEELSIADGEVETNGSGITKGQNIHYQGADASKLELLLEAGQRLSAAEIALLASVGKTEVRIFRYPRTAIISSGDELVDIDVTPEQHQVRRSNSYAIAAAMRSIGWEGTVFHLADDKQQITDALAKIASSFEVIIMSGGVSKGKFDYVPAALESVGIKKLFHRVNQRPGKPFWFGVSAGNIVFALPGNPVSTYMCMYRYILPWLIASVGSAAEQVQAILGEDYNPPKGMTYFLQVRVVNEGGKLIAYPEAGGGSGDFANLKSVTGFLELGPEGSYKKGDVFSYFSFRTQ